MAQSDTWALADARQRPLLLMLWVIAWQQTPCGSLPGEDAIIAARLGLPPEEFQQVNRFCCAADHKRVMGDSTTLC